MSEPFRAYPDATEARAHPVLWAMHASRGAWIPAPHLWFIGDHLVKVSTGEIPRLAISIPPQHGKSELTSKYYPTWHLGRHPGDRILQCSYGQDLTVEWTGQGRDLIAAHGPAVFGIDTWERSKKTAWDAFRNGIRTGGKIRGVGKGGAVPGRPVDLGVCDDLIKGYEEAMNAKLREDTWNWCLSSLFPRCKRLIMMGTRWHHDDVIGRLKALQEAGELGEPWVFINIPAVATNEGNDPLGRKPGEILWDQLPLIPKGMDPVEWYRRKKIDVAHTWDALYQGDPTPATGGMFKKEWFKYFDLIGDVVRVPGMGEIGLSDLRKFATGDLSITKSSEGDWTALGIWGYHPSTRLLLLLHVVRERTEGPEIVPMLRALTDEWDLSTIFLERAAYQLVAKSLVRQAQAEGLPVRELVPVHDKITRAMPMTAALESSRMLLRRGANWLNKFENELLEFPKGQHDDQVDMAAYAVEIANKFRVLRSRRDRPTQDRDDRWQGVGR